VGKKEPHPLLSAATLEQKVK
jgi:hypothetical protein